MAKEKNRLPLAGMGAENEDTDFKTIYQLISEGKSGFTTIPEEERKEKWDYHQNNKGWFDFNLNPFEQPYERQGLEDIKETMIERGDEAERLKKEEAERKRMEPVLKLREEMDKLSEESKAKEDQFRGALLRQTDMSTEAVDNLLSSLIDKTGFVAGLQKQAVGSNLADRGILRSGYAAERLEGVDDTKAGIVTDLVSKRNQQVGKIQDTTRNALRQVKDRRVKIEQELKAAELSGMQDLAYQEKVMRSKMEMEEMISDMQLDSMSTQALFSALGGLTQLAGIGIGYQMGQKPPTGRTDYSGTPGTYGKKGYDFGYTDLPTNYA